MPLHPPPPVEVRHLFAPERRSLLDLLAALTHEEWRRPTACSGWSVHDVVLHLLGGELSNLSRRRDGFSPLAPSPGEPLVVFLNRINEDWVAAARRLSPRVVLDLLAVTGPQMAEYVASLDVEAFGGAVSWAGPEAAPVWLDVAREYTERWHHQQHVRDAVGRPGLREPEFFTPVLATLVRALPYALRDTPASDGTAAQLRIEGPSGGDWTVLREGGRWRLYAGASERPEASVSIGEDAAWRLLTKGGDGDAARIEGDRGLGLALLSAVAIIA